MWAKAEFLEYFRPEMSMSGREGFVVTKFWLEHRVLQLERSSTLYHIGLDDHRQFVLLGSLIRAVDVNAVPRRLLALNFFATKMN